jgi:hypothetical protein
MNNNDLVNLIRKMGTSHQELVSEKLIPNTELKQLYEDEDTLEIEIAPGVELAFWSESLCLEMITFNFERALNKENPEFMEMLPHPLNKLKSQSDVHLELGKPMISKTQLELSAINLYGWEIYQLDTNLHPEATLDIQYNKHMHIQNLIISLMDKNIY